MRSKYSEIPAAARRGISLMIEQDFPLLRVHQRVSEVIDRFRREGLPHKIIYLYVVDDQKKLLGVVPLRRLLASQADTLIQDIYLRKVHSLSIDSTRREAREAFSKYKFLAFPVVDADNVVIGVIDIEKFAGDLGDLNERTHFDDLYDLIGIDLSLDENASAWRQFRMRAPWLLATLVTGFAAALITGAFELTLQKAIILAFFLTMTLGLNESVTMQSATLAVQKMRTDERNPRSFGLTLWHELPVALLLGLFLAFAVGIMSFLWKQNVVGSLALSLSLIFSIVISCGWGVAVPHLLHRYQKDPKVAAGPLALGLADITTLLIYFSLGHFLL
ncbi:MAG: magnesium transporter [Bdellovibrionales bacterium]|nr:magnesium transporter [Bdellovibrionales bacterium]